MNNEPIDINVILAEVINNLRLSFTDQGRKSEVMNHSGPMKINPDIESVPDDPDRYSDRTHTNEV